jgi:chromosome segregation ATPase
MGSKLVKATQSLVEKAVERYNAQYSEYEDSTLRLLSEKTSSVTRIEDIEEFINSIANTPKEIQIEIHCTIVEKQAFETEISKAEALVKNYQNYRNSEQAAGMAAAAVGSQAIMSLVTTFGHATTGEAISALVGVAANNAALANAGFALGAGGIAVGNAALALIGPIGWGLTGLSVIWNAILNYYKSKKTSDNMVEYAKDITAKREQLRETGAKIENLIFEIRNVRKKLITTYRKVAPLCDRDYNTLTEDQQILIGTAANNAHVLASLVNTIFADDTGEVHIDG